MQPSYTVHHTDGPLNYVNAVAVHPQKRRLATAGDDGRVVCWDLPAQTARWEATLSAGGVFDVRYHPAADQWIAASSQGVVALDAERGHEAWRIKRRDHSGWGYTSAELDPKGRVCVAVLGDAHVVHGYGLPARRLNYSVHHVGLRARFRPDGRRVATVGNAPGKLWNPFPRTPPLGPKRLVAPPALLLQTPADVIHDVAFAPDGRRCATADDDGAVRVWATERNDGFAPVLAEHTLPATPRAVAWSPDGSVLAAGDATGHVTWLHPESGTITSVHAHTDGVFGLAFTPGSAWLVSGGGDGRACLWTLPHRPETS